jgi:hypothetical protein
LISPQIGILNHQCGIRFDDYCRWSVAEHDGPPMFARIGIMRALNRGHVREFVSSRKDKHWGRRKLALDQ